MEHTWFEIGKKIAALDLWEKLVDCNWAVKPSGSVFPYFCLVVKGENNPVRGRLLMLPGWKTMGDFVCAKHDLNYSFYSQPMEFPRLELIALADGTLKLFRYETGYMPYDAPERDHVLAAKILWEAYGVMLRLESDENLTIKYAADNAVFARVESKNGEWEDAPLTIPMPRPHIEEVSLQKKLLAQAKELPFRKEAKIDVDFRMLIGVMTKEPKPRTVYALLMDDPDAKKRLVHSRTSVNPEGGLKLMWETIPSQVVREMITLGYVPGEMRCLTQRMFRLLRPICLELPIKLSLHDALPTIGLPG